jgi:hypothetical protein
MTLNRSVMLLSTGLALARAEAQAVLLAKGLEEARPDSESDINHDTSGF